MGERATQLNKAGYGNESIITDFVNLCETKYLYFELITTGTVIKAHLIIIYVNNYIKF
jgi:hypothetical protein